MLDKYMESLELGKNISAFRLGEVPAKIEDPGLFTLPCRLWNSEPFDTLADLGACENIIPLYLFKKLNIILLKETNHVFGLANGTKFYPIGIVRDVEVYIGRLKLLTNFCIIDMKKDPETPLLVGRGFLATVNAVIYCRKAKIVVGEGIARSMFGVKGIELSQEEAPYRTTLGKKESYKPRPSSDGMGTQTLYYVMKDFLDGKPLINKPAASTDRIGTQQTKVPKPTLEDEFQDLRLNLAVFEVLAYALIYNAMLDKYMESLELGKNISAFRLGEVPAKIEDPGLFTLPCRLWNSEPFDTLADLGACENIIPLYLFKKLNIILLKETNHVFGLANGTKFYPIGIVRDVEVYIGRLKLLTNFCIIDMKKDPETPLLVGRGFLATVNAVIYCRKAKIVVGEGIARSMFGVKGIELSQEEAPYRTTLGKKESYKPRPSSDGMGTQTLYYVMKDFLDCHFPGEWEIARDAKINPFKDVLVFRRMVEFLGAIPINLNRNM
nr:hypothetical protein [Tanacetum cinerariifolium]